MNASAHSMRHTSTRHTSTRQTITAWIIALTIGGTNLLMMAVPTAHAGFGDDLKSFASNLVKEDTVGTPSLTDFQGGLQAPTPEGYDTSLTQVTSAREFVVKVVNYVLGFLGLIAVIIVIYGGVRYIMSAGESEGVEKGRKAITYAAIGLLIVTGSYAIVNTVLKAPGGNQQQQGAPQLASSPQYGKNTQATRVAVLAMGALKSFQNYASAIVTIEQLGRNVDKIWIAQEIKDNAQGESALQQIENGYGVLADTLGKIAERSGQFSRIADMVQYQKLFAKNWLEDRKKDLKTSGKFDTKGYADVFVTVLKKGEYVTENGQHVSVGLDKIKAELDADFDAAMTKNSQELKSISNALTNPPEGIQAIFDQLVKYNGTSQDIFAALKSSKSAPLESKTMLKDIAEKLGQLYESLKDLQGVRAELSANVKEGNAPLIVNFKTAGSSDPSNQSITDDRIAWDLDGDGQFSTTGKTKNALDCVEPLNANATCVYKKPGTYRVAVKIKSATPDKVVEGVDYVDIVVNPPRARFAIKIVETGANKSYEVTDYDKDGLIKIDRENIQLAYSNIIKGLKFSAVGTTSGDIIDRSDKNIDIVKKTQESIQRVRWMFSDGYSVDDSPAENASILEVDHTFSNKGTYQVALEITGKDGIVDRKIFNVIVADISAIINVSPGYKTKVNTPLTFGSAITSDNSKVVLTQWSASPDTEKLTSTNPSFSASLDKPGHYTVQLRVQNEMKAEATDKVDITIESNPPIAKFSVRTPKASRPSEMELNASDTYDPDGPNPNILYQWKIQGDEGKDYQFVKGGETEKIVTVKFLTIGEHKIDLRAEDQNEKGKFTTATQSVTVATTMAADWLTTMQTAGLLDKDGTANMNFGFTADGGTNYSWDFGDGEVEDGIFNGKHDIQTKHMYKAAGIYTVAVSIQDDQGNTLKLSKKIAIGAGNAPVISVAIRINGEDADEEQTIVANRKDVITFDAAGSKNADGSGKNLVYAWDFGDGKKTTKAVATHTYQDISPADKGYFEVTLTVSDSQNPTKKTQEKYKVNIITQKPTVKTIVVVPLAAEYKTPLKVQLKAIEPKAPEGQIVSYRWWYFDAKDPSIELGSQLTTTPDTTVTIGTKGNENEEVTYGFDMEIRDTANQTVRASDIVGPQNIPTLTVINGPNKPPVASLIVNKTSINVGDAITFTSTASDPDGKIMQYVWDLNGNGFQDDEGTQKSSVTQTYADAAPNGIKVRLKVIDDSFTEAVSEPVTIFVTSSTQPPKAAFTFEQKPNSLDITFKNNTTTDEKASVKKNEWDFDTTSSLKSADSDGDGKKDNDVDSTEAAPDHTYEQPGIYYIKLTVTDSVGLKNSVINPVEVKPVISPSAPSNPSAPSTSASPSTPSSTSSTPSLSTSSTTSPQSPQFFTPTGTGTGTGDANTALNAKMITSPDVDGVDGKIHLTGESGNIVINFAASEGAVAKYVIDKNIYFDSNGDGAKDNDENFVATSPGKWTTDFHKNFGKIGIKLTVYDATQKHDSVIREVVFDSPLALGANNLFVIPGPYELYGSLASMFGFGILAARKRKKKQI